MDEIKRLFPYIKPYLPIVLLAGLLLILCGFLEAVIIMLLAPIFDQLAPAVGTVAAGSGGKFAFLQDILGLEGDYYLARVAMFLVLFSLLKGVFLFVADYSMNLGGQKLVAGMRRELYSHFLDQSLTFFSRYPTGKLMARVITDTERLQDAVGKRLTDFVRQVFLLIFFLALVFYADWKMALLSFCIAPLILSITVRLGRRMRRESLRSQESLSDISHTLQQTISGQKIVKAFVAEDLERRRFGALNDRLVRTNLRIAKVNALGSPLIEFIGYLAFVPFLLYFNYKISHGFTLSAFVVFVAALFRLYEPIKKLSRMHLHFQQTLASVHRIFEVLDSRPEITDAPGAGDLPPLRREIGFEGVSFSYAGGAELPVLRDVDLRVRKGEIVALVGMSGAGKTTLVNLIPRFYDPTQGRIRIDGVDIRTVTVRSLRSQIALVTQDTFLFDDSVRANIAYGSERPFEAVVEAARAAFIHDFVMELPEGYDTIIGERGHRLSGGQRQRMAIARAILKRAPILILDEATSALDSESERLVQQALHNLMTNCTTLVIAHRLSTVRLAHRIVVLDRGGIVEEGSHEALMRNSGIYRKLYELQFIDVEVPTQPA